MLSKADAARAIRDIMNGKMLTDIRTGHRGRARSRGQGAARRTRSVAPQWFAWGMEQGHCKTNPFCGIVLSGVAVRERFLTKEGAVSLFDAITRLESGGSLASTFRRRVEASSARGSAQGQEVDLGRKVITLPPDRGGATSASGVAPLFALSISVTCACFDPSRGELTFTGAIFSLALISTTT
jgi:hypothetical protein